MRGTRRVGESWGPVASALVIQIWPPSPEAYPVPLYVGSAWLPRHVVLAVGPTAEGVDLYDPAHGRISELTRAAFEAGELTTTRQWHHPWFVIAPGRRAGAPGGTRGA